MVEVMIMGFVLQSVPRRHCCPQCPDPAAGHCQLVPLQETLKHSSVSVCVGSLGPGVHEVGLSPLNISGKNGV